MKYRKPKTDGYESCPECGAIKRYTICLGCGWMSEKDKKKDKKLWATLEKKNVRQRKSRKK